jgi:CRP-like cAMP-binding protein
MRVSRTATVTAMTPCVVASCDARTFEELVRPLFADDGSDPESDRTGLSPEV